jgi:hypothetical protein
VVIVNPASWGLVINIHSLKSGINSYGRASNDAIAKIGRYQVFYLGVGEVAHMRDTLKLRVCK